MTQCCFLSCGFTTVLPELDDDLSGVFLLGLYAGCELDLLWSLEWVEELLCEDDLWYGVLQCKQWVLWQWCEVLLWWQPLYLLCDMEWPLWGSWWLWLLYPHGWDCDLNLLCLYLSLWCHLEVDLVQCLVLEFSLWWHMGVPDGGILSGQSATIWPYSSHSKQHTFRQWHAMWPNSWHWKHWSSLLDITLTDDEGNKVAVSCCTAWSVSTFLMASARVWGPFS